MKRIHGRTATVRIGRYKVKTYSYGDRGDVLFLLNGGPGLPCNYLRDPLIRMTSEGLRVVTYDQLGCARRTCRRTSPLDDRALCRGGGDRQDVAGARQGSSAGAFLGRWLSIDYALKYQGNLKSLVLSNTCGDMPHLVSELERHRAALGPETVAMMQRHEAEGSLNHPTYQAAITILNYRHVLRLDHWPASVNASLSDWNPDVYGTMQGPNEFLYTGNLKDWNRIPRMPEIKTPTLIMCGFHDELTPACSMRMHLALPKSEITVFPNSSHLPMHEEPEAYIARLTRFLKRHSGRSR
jgi:proline iminopeptidase